MSLPAAKPHQWRLLIVVFFVVLAAYGVSPVVSNGDSYLVAPTSASIVNDFNLDISESIGPGTAGGIAWIGDGDSGVQTPGLSMTADPPVSEPVYDYFPWTTAMVGAVLYVVLLIPGALLGISFFDPRRMVAEGDAGLFNLIGGSVLTALMVAIVAATVDQIMAGRGADSRTRRRAVIATALVVAFGTSAWSVLSRAMWSQATSTLLVALLFYEVVRLEQAAPADRRPWGIALGATAAIAYTARPTNAVSVVVVGAWLLVQHRRQLLPYVVSGATVGAAWIAVNLATWSTLQPPYFSPERAAPESYLLEALAGNLISPNRGLLIFSPVALVAAVGAWTSLREGRQRSLIVLGVCIVVTHWALVSGAGEGWWAGSTYGPRFMADIIPALAFLSVPAVAKLVSQRSERSTRLRRATLALAAVSVLMHAPGAWSKPASCWSLEPPRVDEDTSRVWDWDDLQALEPVRVVLDGGSVRDAVLRRCDHLLDTAPA